MRAVVLAGGLGTRLHPLTLVTNKHLLAVYKKPMLYYPLELLAEAGFKEAMIVVGGQSTEEILKLCKDGRQFGFERLYYCYQEGEGGIAAALALTDHFVGLDSVCVVLGDNILLGQSIRSEVQSFRRGAHVFLAVVPDPQNYGVPTLEGYIVKITEKPVNPASKLGVMGIYLYDNSVFERIKCCKPSVRNELEITDVNNSYASVGLLDYSYIRGTCIDAGSSIEALVHAGEKVMEYETAGVRV